jgi:ribosomal protein S18 acetylase RimI-like enzyme
MEAIRSIGELMAEQRNELRSRVDIPTEREPTTYSRLGHAHRLDDVCCEPLLSTKRFLVDAFDIEERESTSPMHEKNFVRMTRDDDVKATAALYANHLVGFIASKERGAYLHILSLNVHHLYRRCGVGKTLVEAHKDLLDPDEGPDMLRMEIDEDNLALLALVSGCGLKLTESKRATGTYVMEFEATPATHPPKKKADGSKKK